jgi:hypothetical protein
MFINEHFTSLPSGSIFLINGKNCVVRNVTLVDKI